MEEEQVIELYSNKTITKTLPLMPYIKYAIAACLVIGLGFWFENSQNHKDVPS